MWINAAVMTMFSSFHYRFVSLPVDAFNFCEVFGGTGMEGNCYNQWEITHFVEINTVLRAVEHTALADFTMSLFQQFIES